MKPETNFFQLMRLLLISSLVYSCSNQENTGPVFPEDHLPKLEWWQDARFGMFIHWGPVSIKGTEIGWSRGREIPVSTYDSLYLQFNPVNFNADEWVSIAKEAGMKYIVFTSKHHDGFCNWDTQYNDYNIMNTPFKRDIMAELSIACKKQGMALGFYHSTCDWLNPDFPLTSPGGTIKRDVYDLERYTRYLKDQSVEIIEKYGPLLVMWYDVPQCFDSVRGQGVIDHIREVQPGILVNNRTGAKGDFDTPEQRLGSFQNDRPWETCMTIATQWAWKPNDEVKSTEQCLHSLIRSAGGDGNLLFNVGPKPDGTIETAQVERLKEMGAWLKQYGFSIYGTRGGPFKPSDWGVSTRKGNKIYLHILNLPGKSPKIEIPDLGMDIIKCSLVGGEDLHYFNENGNIVIPLENLSASSIDNIILIEIAGDAMNIPPIDPNPITHSFKKPVSCSSNQEPQWVKQEWIDINSVTNGDWSGDFWHPADNDAEPWIRIDLKSIKRVRGVIIYQKGNNIRAFDIRYKSGDKWLVLYSGQLTGGKKLIEFPETDMKEIEMVIRDFTGIPGIYEIEVF